jgi:hypothetical protein
MGKQYESDDEVTKSKLIATLNSDHVHEILEEVKKHVDYYYAIYVSFELERGKSLDTDTLTKFLNAISGGHERGRELPVFSHSIIPKKPITLSMRNNKDTGKYFNRCLTRIYYLYDHYDKYIQEYIKKQGGDDQPKDEPEKMDKEQTTKIWTWINEMRADSSLVVGTFESDISSKHDECFQQHYKLLEMKAIIRFLILLYIFKSRDRPFDNSRRLTEYLSGIYTIEIHSEPKTTYSLKIITVKQNEERVERERVARGAGKQRGRPRPLNRRR